MKPAKRLLLFSEFIKKCARGAEGYGMARALVATVIIFFTVNIFINYSLPTISEWTQLPLSQHDWFIYPIKFFIYVFVAHLIWTALLPISDLGKTNIERVMLSGTYTLKSRRIFLSYAHSTDEHAEMIRTIAFYIRKAGGNIITDQTHLYGGREIKGFMNSSLDKADTAIVIIDENYCKRLDIANSGVNYEYLYILNRLRDGAKLHVLPVVVRSQFLSSFELEAPKGLNDFLQIEWRQGEGYLSKNLNSLLAALNNTTLTELMAP